MRLPGRTKTEFRKGGLWGAGWAIWQSLEEKPAPDYDTIQKRLGLHRVTVERHMKALRTRGYVVQDAEMGLYHAVQPERP